MKWPFVSREFFDATVALWVQQVHRLDQALAKAHAQLDDIARMSLAERDRMTERHAAEIDRLHAMYARVIETQASAQKAAVEHAMNLVNFGMPQRKEAVIEEREPDAAVRAARQVQEETIARATESLKHRYAEIGVTVTDEELRDEAITLVTGGRWKPPAALQPFLKD